jgi:hypothetical protein
VAVVLVMGDRKWTDMAMVGQMLEGYPPGTVLVHADRRGAEQIADKIGRALALEVKPEAGECGQLEDVAWPGAASAHAGEMAA